MGNSENTYIYKQMEHDGNGYGYGIVFLLGGVVFLIVGICALFAGQIMGLGLAAMGIIFACFGFPMVICYHCRLKITLDEVTLTLGPVVLQRMAVSEVQTLGYATLVPNIRGRPWKAEIIVLSPHTSAHMRRQCRRKVKEDEISGFLASETEKERLILKKSVAAYMESITSGFHLAEGEGIWIEYIPGRVDELMECFPNAEDFVS